MSRLHRGLNQRRWRAVRRRVLIRDGWRCTECGRPGRLEVDHRVPLERGGDPWELDNLQSLCRDCHHGKTRREFGKQVAGRDAWLEVVKRAFT